MKRRPVGFRRAGSCSPEQLGLPPAKARELLLALAWADVAGAALARRVPARRIHRGVLELEVSDARWAETVRALLPKLAGRLVATHPELGLRKVRLIEVDSSAPALCVEPDATVAGRAPAVAPRLVPAGPAGPPDPLAVMEAYLARSEATAGSTGLRTWPRPRAGRAPR